MSNTELYPSCRKNKTCQGGVPVVIVGKEEANPQEDALELSIAVSSPVMRQVCFIVESAIHEAIRQGTKRLTFVLEGYFSQEDLTRLTLVINCRAILQLNQSISGPHSLEEIRIACEPQHEFIIRRALASQYPMCFSCFEDNNGDALSE